jgi:hypothetical protein
VATLAPDVGVPPIGERIWGETRLDLSGLAPDGYRDVLTGRCVAVQRDGGVSLRAAEVFGVLPIAVLAETS